MNFFQHAIALTGSIGSGKSTLVSFLTLYGYQSVCADSIAHQVLMESTSQVLAHFGEEVSDGYGGVSRKKLGDIVFASESKRQELQNLLHPEIKRRIYEQAYKLEPSKTWYFLDIPLFFEVGGKAEYPVNRSLVVYTPREQALQRIIQRDGLSLQQAQLRLNAQMDIEEKCRLADDVLRNDGDLKALQHNLEAFLQTL